MKNVFKQIADKARSLTNTKNIAALTVSLFAMMVMASSCKEDDPVTPEPKPDPKPTYTDSLRLAISADNTYEGLVYDVNKVNDSLRTSKRPLAKIEILNNMSTTKEKFEILKAYQGWKSQYKDKFVMNGKIYPAEYGMMLSTEQCHIAKDFNIYENPKTGDKFWVTPEDKSIFTSSVLERMNMADDKVIISGGGKDYDAGIEKAEFLSKTKKISVVFDNVEIDAEDLVKMRKLRNPNIVVVHGNNGKITAAVNEQPTPAYVINSTYGFNVPVDLVIFDNPNAPGGMNAIGFNDSTATVLRTKDTMGKSGGHVTTLDQRKKVTTPIIGTFSAAPWVSDATVDGVKPEKINVKTAVAGTYGTENGGYYMLLASYQKVGGKFKEQSVYPQFADGDVVLKLTTDPQYYGKYSFGPQGSYKCINIMADDISSVEGLSNPVKTLGTGYGRVSGNIILNGEIIAIIAEKGTNYEGILWKDGTSVGALMGNATSFLQTNFLQPQNITAFPVASSNIQGKIFSLSNVPSR